MQRALRLALRAGSGRAVLIMLLASCESAPRTDSAPLWRVEVDGRESSLLGTIHGGVDPEALPESMWQRLERSRVAITETDVRSIRENDYRDVVTLPAGERLRDYVSDDDWRLLVRELSPFFPSSVFERYQPWYLHGILVSSYLPSDYPPVDFAVMQRAEQAGVQIAFFEHWLYQVELLNGLGIEDGLAELLMVAHDPVLARAILQQWLVAYRAGDTDTLHAFVLDRREVERRPRYYEEIIFQRNRAWLPRIEREILAGDAFIAVGFAHMLGDQGIVAMLQQRGFDVEVVE